MHADLVADDLSEREEALRKLPLPYSLVLRLREAGVAREVICEYVGVEDASLDGVYRIAEAKLEALAEVTTGSAPNHVQRIATTKGLGVRNAGTR
ncbi:MAG: hypothetical protein QOH91_2730 [Mycobacterium sp.]|jgi:hypothetical protein|nr:hypothetical protein [Mycobacterium sp.]